MSKFLSDEEIANRVSSPDNLVNKITIHQIKHGRGGVANLPIQIKKVVSILGNEGEKQDDLAETFGMSQYAVSKAVNALDPSGLSNRKDERLIPVVKQVKDAIKSQREKAEELAISNMLEALGALPGKIEGAKLKDISSMAKDMSIIANQMADKNVNPDGSKSVHLHLYAPRQKAVEEYDVIDV